MHSVNVKLGVFNTKIIKVNNYIKAWIIITGLITATDAKHMCLLTITDVMGYFSI